MFLLGGSIWVICKKKIIIINYGNITTSPPVSWSGGVDMLRGNLGQQMDNQQRFIFHQRLEKHCRVSSKCLTWAFFTNGTPAPYHSTSGTANTGEVITTPTASWLMTHSLWWNGIKPVFVDDPATCNLDPEKIEAAITPKTTAIML